MKLINIYILYILKNVLRANFQKIHFKETHFRKGTYKGTFFKKYLLFFFILMTIKINLLCQLRDHKSFWISLKTSEKYNNNKLEFKGDKKKETKNCIIILIRSKEKN